MKNRVLGTVRAVGSFALVSILFMILGNIPASMTSFEGQDMLEQGILVIDYAATMGVLLMLPLLYSLIRTEAVYDTSLRDAYMAKNCKLRTFGDKAAFFMEQKRFWIEAAAFAALFWIVPLDTFNRCIVLLFTDGTPTFGEKLIVFFVLLPLMLFADLYARISAADRWKSCAYKAEMEKGKTNGKAKQYLLCIFAYSLGSVVLIRCALPILLTVLSIVMGEYAAQGGVPGIFIAAAVLFVLYWMVRILRAISIRRAFFMRLRKICRGKGYHLTEVKHPYLSAFFSPEGESFRVETGKKTYSCKMIGGTSKYLPMTLYPDGNGCHNHVIRLYKVELLRYDTWFPFGYDSEHTRVLIVNPIPKKVWSRDVGKTFLLDNGDRVGKFRFYAGTAFLNALERECVDW
ncbi:MAG: hypothetical protein IJW95_03105 [Clostridia bacterium]|nr:hypothetical protein [Clostridia bacterium]